MELLLEKPQLDLLRQLQRNTADRTTYQRLTTLVMIHKGLSAAFIADTLGVDQATIYRHYHQYQATPTLEAYLQQHYKPCVGKLSPAQLTQLTTYLKANLQHCSAQIRTHIQTTYQLTYTTEGVIALLHRLGFSYKKTRLVPSKCNEQAQLEWQDYFRKLETQLPVNEAILFGDGVHPKHNTESTYGWIERGTDFDIPANTGRQRVNINGAINPYDLTQVIAHECTTINALTTIAFFAKIEAYYPTMERIHLFVDNARYYRSKLVSAYVQGSPIELHFLPPYSPNLNPIERLWKYLKKVVIKSNYTPDFTVFRHRILDFFSHIDQHKEALTSLINTKFQIIKPVMVNLQTSVH